MQRYSAGQQEHQLHCKQCPPCPKTHKYLHWQFWDCATLSAPPIQSPHCTPHLQAQHCLCWVLDWLKQAQHAVHIPELVPWWGKGKVQSGWDVHCVYHGFCSGQAMPHVAPVLATLGFTQCESQTSQSRHYISYAVGGQRRPHEHNLGLKLVTHTTDVQHVPCWCNQTQGQYWGHTAGLHRLYA